MALNLRTIDKPLHDALKIWAMSSGKSLDEFCVDLLRKALLAGTIPSRREPDIEATYEAFEQLPESHQHDTKTCRIYKCGMCAAIKGDK